MREKKHKRSSESHASRITHHVSAPIEVAAALIFRCGKLLIAQRHAGAHLGGLWEFPGGKRRPDETFEECLARELREELGIEVTIGGLFETLTHQYPGKTVHLKFFRCQWKQNEPQALDCAAFKWISADELEEYTFPEADALILQRLREQAELWQS
jgi:mutator protein MutT